MIITAKIHEREKFIQSYGQSSNRGLTMGSFGSSQFDSVYESAAAHGYSISRAPATRLLPNLGECRSMMVTDPSGFDINIFES